MLGIVAAVLKPVTYKMMKPQLELILFEMVFPLLCFNEQDAELWRDDVHEYVRKGRMRITVPCLHGYMHALYEWYARVCNYDISASKIIHASVIDAIQTHHPPPPAPLGI